MWGLLELSLGGLWNAEAARGVIPCYLSSSVILESLLGFDSMHQKNQIPGPAWCLSVRKTVMRRLAGSMEGGGGGTEKGGERDGWGEGRTKAKEEEVKGEEEEEEERQRRK